ncbi:MAG: LytTR family DNA-binding domain-containing protein [Prolixibacteraceae bacterium]
MITAILIDDEQHAIDRLTSLLRPYRNDIRILNTFGTVDEAVKGITELNPDVIFLDVQLHDRTGFEVLKEVPDTGFSLIFTTAFEQYAVQAFKFSALDYLLKPIDGEEFSKAIRKVVQKSENEQLSQKIRVLLSNLPEGNKPKRISVPTLDGYIFLEISDIVRCQSDVNYTHIFTRSRQRYIASKTLKHFEELLAACNFFRIHNSHLINLEYIKRYTKGKGGYVTLTDGSTLEVSMRRKEEFLKMVR